MHATYLTPAALAAQCLREDPSFRLLTPAEQRGEAREALRLISGCDADDIDLQLETIALATAPVEVSGNIRVVDTGRKRLSVAVPVASEPVGVAEEPAEAVAAPVGVPDRSDRVRWVPVPCRKPGACTERLAATGRCMDCGAQRKEPKGAALRRPEVAALDPVDRPDPIFNKKPPKPKNATRVTGAKMGPAGKSVTTKSKLNITVANTPEAFARRRAELARGNILHRVKALTNAPDHYLAKVLNRSRASIQAYTSERIDFTPDRWQLGQMQQLLLQQRMMLDDALDAIEAATEGARK